MANYYHFSDASFMLTYTLFCDYRIEHYITNGLFVGIFNSIKLKCIFDATFEDVHKIYLKVTVFGYPSELMADISTGTRDPPQRGPDCPI